MQFLLVSINSSGVAIAVYYTKAKIGSWAEKDRKLRSQQARVPWKATYAACRPSTGTYTNYSCLAPSNYSPRAQARACISDWPRTCAGSCRMLLYIVQV